MTHAGSRKSSVPLFVALIIFLIMVVAFAARAQVAGAVPMFKPAVNYDSGGVSALSIAVADLNGDGKLDVVVTNNCWTYDSCTYDPFPNSFGHTTVGVLLGNGDGTLQAVVTYDALYRYVDMLSSVAVGDLNGDGKPDIVLTNVTGNTTDTASYAVSVLYGYGDGTFTSPVSFDPAGWAPAALAIGDLNQDGALDLAVANTCYAQPLCTPETCTCEHGLVSVLLNDGYGYFHLGGALDPGAPYSRSLALADVNGDGKTDIVVVNDSNVGVLLSSGNGVFAPAKVYSTGGTRAWSVAVGDVNNDGKPDVLVGNVSGPSYSSDGTIGLLLGNGDGTFRQAVSNAIGGYFPYSIALGDLNGDGKADLVLATGGTDVRVLLGNGDGSFKAAVPFSSGGYGPRAVVVADLNADGKLDLIMANSNHIGDGDDSVAVLIGKKAPSTAALASSLNPSFAGQAVTFKAAVKSTIGIPIDGEIVTFRSGSLVLGTSPLRGGMASLTTSSLLPRTQVISAAYSGDANLMPSTASLAQVVNGYATSVAIASSLNPSVFGQPISWIAQVHSVGPTTPTGNVTLRWSRDGRNFNIGTAPINAAGVATLTRSNLNADPTGEPYPLVAVYSGDATNLGSTSAILSQDVLQAKSTASITSSVNPSKQGQPVTFTARINSPTVLVTGPVTFSMGYTVLGTAQLAGGVAKFTTSGLPIGLDRIKVTYAGDSNVAKSSASLVQTVQ